MKIQLIFLGSIIIVELCTTLCAFFVSVLVLNTFLQVTIIENFIEILPVCWKKLNYMVIPAPKTRRFLINRVTYVSVTLPHCDKS